jgi:hypothetical protein
MRVSALDADPAQLDRCVEQHAELVEVLGTAASETFVDGYTVTFHVQLVDCASGEARREGRRT